MSFQYYSYLIIILCLLHFDIYFVTVLTYSCHTAYHSASSTNTFGIYANSGLFLLFHDFTNQFDDILKYV